MRYCFSLLLFFFVQHSTAQSINTEVPTVEFVDLQKYVGTWFEIASIPQWFQRKCVANTTAEYRLAEDGLISIANSCDSADGERRLANGRAKVVDSKSNSKLKVTFVNFWGWQFLLGGDYWILSIGENYAYAVVVSPWRNYAWILSRTPQISREYLNEATQVLLKNGFDICKLMTTPQKGGFLEKKPLCKVEAGG